MSETFLIPGSIRRQISVNAHNPSREVPIIFVRFYGKFNFLDRFFGKNPQTSNFIKKLPVGVELLHAGGRTDGYDETNSRFSQFCEKRLRKRNHSSGKKVKCTLVQALRPCAGRTAHRGSRGIALPFQDHGTRRGEWSASRPGHTLLPGKTWYPLFSRMGGPQARFGQVRKISPHRDSIPGPSARSQSLYRMSYLAHIVQVIGLNSLPGRFVLHNVAVVQVSPSLSLSPSLSPSSSSFHF